MKKGFTLIELLAVILILGIIALIAIPMVSDAIEEAKKNAAINTAYGYVKAIENNNALSDINPASYTYIGNENVSNINSLVSLKGTKPSSGSVNVVDGFVSTASLCIGKYQVSYSNSKATISGKCGEILTYPVFANGTAVYFNPETGLTCDSSSSVSTSGTINGCMKWYTFLDDENSSSVNMILDHNVRLYGVLYSGENALLGPDSSAQSILNVLQEDASTWLGVPTRTDTVNITSTNSEGDSYTFTVNYNGLKARIISVEEILEIINNTTFDVVTSDDTSSVSLTGYEWLIDNLYEGGYHHSYWTLNPVANNYYYAWMLDDYPPAGLSSNQVDASGNAGLRPVITIPKSLLD